MMSLLIFHMHIQMYAKGTISRYLPKVHPFPCSPGCFQITQNAWQIIFSFPFVLDYYSPLQSLAYLLEAIKHPKSEALPVTTSYINRIQRSNFDR